MNHVEAQASGKAAFSIRLSPDKTVEDVIVDVSIDGQAQKVQLVMKEKLGLLERFWGWLKGIKWRPIQVEVRSSESSSYQQGKIKDVYLNVRSLGLVSSDKLKKGDFSGKFSPNDERQIVVPNTLVVRDALFPLPRKKH